MNWLRFLFLLLPIWAGCGSPSGGGVHPNNTALVGLGGQLVPDAVGNVVEANFTGRPLGDPDLAIIAKHGSIQKLWLTNTGITDAGLVHLQSMPTCGCLSGADWCDGCRFAGLGKHPFPARGIPISQPGER